MIEQIIIIKESGLPIFSWIPEGEEDKSDLISGFLTAINMFAQTQKGENIKKITMDPTTFIFEKFDDNILVILTLDQKFEKILFSIITEIKEKFLEKYSEKLVNFNGDLNVYKPFKERVRQILDEYFYFDYLKTKQIFEEKNTLQSSLYIDRIKGDILYIISKEYIDRNILGFHTSILVKTLGRIINNVLNEDNKLVILVSKKNKNLIIRYSEKIIFIQEIDNLFKIDNLDIQVQEKKIKKNLREPGKLFFDLDFPIVISDDKGVGIVSSDATNKMNKKEIAADLTTLIHTSQNITNNIYKDEFLVLFFITDQSIYANLRIVSYESLLKIRESNIEDAYNAINQSIYSKENANLNNAQINKNIDNIAKFLKLFK